MCIVGELKRGAGRPSPRARRSGLAGFMHHGCIHIRYSKNSIHLRSATACALLAVRCAGPVTRPVTRPGFYGIIINNMKHRSSRGYGNG